MYLHMMFYLCASFSGDWSCWLRCKRIKKVPKKRCISYSFYFPIPFFGQDVIKKNFQMPSYMTIRTDISMPNLVVIPPPSHKKMRAESSYAWSQIPWRHTLLNFSRTEKFSLIARHMRVKFASDLEKVVWDLQPPEES